jgi:hypothetical protein
VAEYVLAEISKPQILPNVNEKTILAEAKSILAEFDSIKNYI